MIELPYFMGTVRGRIGYCLQSFLRRLAAVAITVMVTLQTRLSEFCLGHALCKANRCHETVLTTCFSPKEEEHGPLWPDLAPSLAEKPLVMRMGVVNLEFGEAEEEGAMCGFNSGFARLSSSIKPPLY